jgi:hypothetical protein
MLNPCIVRVIIANVVRNFDLEFGEGYSEQKFIDDWKDYFVLAIGPLEMRFIPRVK